VNGSDFIDFVANSNMSLLLVEMGMELREDVVCVHKDSFGAERGQSIPDVRLSDHSPLVNERVETRMDLFAMRPLALRGMACLHSHGC
jgi:hypothetical protein